MPRGILVVLALLWSVAAAAGLDFAGLQAALDAARLGQTIVVPAGEYRGQLVISTSVVLRGQPGAVLVHRPGEGGPTLWIRAPGVSVEGLVIEGTGEGTRRDHTAVVVTAPRVVLSNLVIRRAWAGLWIENADGVVVEGLKFQGLVDFPFWERGDAVRVTGAKGTRLSHLELVSAADGVSLEKDSDSVVTSATVTDARYGVHLMFSRDGSLTNVHTRRTVAGLMAMESAAWTVDSSTFTEGYRTGSAGVRQVRTTDIVIRRSLIARNAAGIEVLDVRRGLFEGNRLEENAVAWTWGGDNSGTWARGNTHRGNLLDVAGTEPTESDLAPRNAHDHSGNPVQTTVTGRKIRPEFDRNRWDAWHGWDLDGDGVGDTPFLYDPRESARAASQPWRGLFLGSPWAVLTQALPSGTVLDPHPVSD